MGVPKDLISQLRHHLRPLSTKIANTIGRGVVRLANDAKKLQLLQIGMPDEDPIDEAQYHQAYGLSSVPLVGAEAVVVFPNGDRSHPLVVSVSDRRYRPVGGQPGEVTVYNNTGASITMTKDGDIIGKPATGREFYVRSEGGTADRLVKKSEFDGHTHDAGTITAPSSGGTCTGTSAGADAVDGTQTFQAE